MKSVPVLAAIALLAVVLVPMAADGSSAYTVSSYVFEPTNEGFEEGEYYIYSTFEFGSAPSSVPTLKYYSNSSCTDLVDEATIDSYNDTTYIYSVQIADCPSTLYAKLSVGSQYSIYQISVYEVSSGTEETTSFSLSSSGVDSATVADSVYSFYYIWVFDSDITDYVSSVTVELCSDSGCSDVVSTYDDLGGLTYDSVLSGLGLTATTSLSDFYLKVCLGTQYWISHVVLSVSEDDSSVVDVETDEVTDSSDSSSSDSASLIFDSADTLLKVLAVLGCVLVVVFVVFGFGMKNTRRVRR